VTRRGRIALALSAAAALAASGPARACSVCAAGDPLLGASDPAAVGGRLRLQLDAEYLRASSASALDPGATERLTQWSFRLNVAARATEDLALSATLPLVDKAVDRIGAGVTTRVSSATGLGDAEAAARYVLWRGRDLGVGRTVEAAVSAGTSMPTGANDLRANGERIDEHGQPGTGTWGPFAGLHGRVQQGRWSSFASFSGRLRTTNAHGYRYGAALLWSAHAQVRAMRRLAVDLGVDGRYAAPDRDGGASVADTGGTVLSAAPGLFLDVGGGAWLFVRGQIPFVERLRGTQDVSPSVVTGIQHELL
jgi:hypothetical protein